MTTLERIRSSFGINWTTILVGWRGLGVLSVWPQRWLDFPPLLTSAEIDAYANERLALRPSDKELNSITDLSIALGSERRQDIASVLEELSATTSNNPVTELRKWRLALLEELMAKLPNDPVQGLVALSEFWQSFGFPKDSPHQVQGRDNKIPPAEYYRREIFLEALERHKNWIRKEEDALRRL